MSKNLNNYSVKELKMQADQLSLRIPVIIIGWDNYHV